MLKIIYPNTTYMMKMMAKMEYDIVCMACQYKMPLLQSDDIAQELRFRLFSQLSLYNPLGETQFRTWALKVLKNHLKNLYRDLARTAKRKTNMNLVPLEKWLEKGQRDNYDNLHLVIALKELPSLEKAIVFNRFIKGISREKTAKTLKMTKYKVLKAEKKAKSLLKTILSF